MINLDLLRVFIVESNAIEGIFTEPSECEIEAYYKFVTKPDVSVDDLIEFVAIAEPTALLRSQVGMNVSVGNHLPPSGGLAVALALTELLENAEVSCDAFTIHVHYEQLHPFTDCNGRSGRALWLRMMQRIHGEYGGLKLSFLHQFYYQTLNYLQRG